MPKVSEMKDAVFDGRKMGLRAAEEAVDLPEAQAAQEKRQENRPDHLRGDPPQPVARERGARRDHPAPVGVARRDVRARPNPSILTEDGEFVYFGPYMQYMSGVTDTQVKWTLGTAATTQASETATCSSRTTPGSAPRTSRTSCSFVPCSGRASCSAG